MSHEDHLPIPNLVIHGHGTAFLTELAPRKQLVLPKVTGYATVEVLEVLSDTRVRVKKAFGGGEKTAIALSNEGEDGKQGSKYQVLPYVDQSKMYGSVYQRLAEGGCVGIFPEGEFPGSAFDKLSLTVSFV